MLFSELLGFSPGSTSTYNLVLFSPIRSSLVYAAAGLQMRSTRALKSMDSCSLWKVLSITVFCLQLNKPSTHITSGVLVKTHSIMLSHWAEPPSQVTLHSVLANRTPDWTDLFLMWLKSDVPRTKINIDYDFFKNASDVVIAIKFWGMLFLVSWRLTNNYKKGNNILTCNTCKLTQILISVKIFSHLCTLKKLKMRLSQTMTFESDTVGPQEQYLTYGNFLEGRRYSYQIGGLCYEVFLNDCGSELSEPMLLSLSSGWPQWQDFLFFHFGSARLVWFVCFQ